MSWPWKLINMEENVYWKILPVGFNKDRPGFFYFLTINLVLNFFLWSSVFFTMWFWHRCSYYKHILVINKIQTYSTVLRSRLRCSLTICIIDPFPSCLLTFCIVVFVYKELNNLFVVFLCCFCFVCMLKSWIVLFVNEELILLC